MADPPDNEVTQLAVIPQMDTGEHTFELPDAASLMVLVGSEAGRTFIIDGDATVGRSPDAKVRINSGDVSRVHALIKKIQPGQFTIQDLNSKNGTLVNGVPIQEQALKYGDKIRIGTSTTLLFSPYDPNEDQILQVQRLESIGQLASGVAHDFNNILGAVKANVGFLKGLGGEATFTSKDVQGCLDDIDLAVDRAVDLARQLLGLSRRERTKDRQVNFSEVVTDVINLIRRTISRSITIEVNVADNLITKGDPSQLSQMLMNLCINARDAMPDGGLLRIAAGPLPLGVSEAREISPGLGPGWYVEVVVSDTGMGMDEEVRRRVFEPYFTTKPAGEGTGLGMSTVFQIVKHHGGMILLDSEPKRGTVVRVILPAVEKHGSEKPIVAFGLGHTQRFHPGLILLVDDEELFRKSACRLLEGMGYAVLCADDGIEAMKMLEKHQQRIKLVLLDLNMPNMNGTETFRAMRQMNPDIKVLLISGQTQLGTARQLLSEGAKGFLQKPFDVGALGHSISRTLYGR